CARLPGSRVSQLGQLDFFVLMPLNSGANLLCRPSLLRHLVGVSSLLRAGRALSTMESRKTTAQAGVAKCAITSAIAGQLIEHDRNFRRLFVDFYLPGIAEIGSGKLLARKDRRQDSG